MSSRRHRGKIRSGVAAAGACLATAVAAMAPTGAAQAAPFQVLSLWKVTWTAPVTSGGPNSFSGAVRLDGTASHPLGPTSLVDFTVTSNASLPDGCGTFPQVGRAAVQGKAFTVTPNLPCNGTYQVSVVAQTGSGLLASRSRPLTAPVTVVDAGTAVTGARGTVDGASRSVSIAWDRSDDPDVVGYRVRRDGTAVGDVGPEATVWSGHAPSPGTFSFDVVALRWGAGGPGSDPVQSPASTPLRIVVDPSAPPASVGGGSGAGGGSSAGSTGGPSGSPGTSGGSAAGGSGGSGGSGAKGSAPAPNAPKAPSASASVAGRDGYRSGGTVSAPGAPTAEAAVGEPDTFEERLPYEAQTELREVAVSSPGRTETVSSTVAVPSRHKPGLLVPLAAVLVLVAASLQVRSLLGRVRAAGGGVGGS